MGRGVPPDHVFAAHGLHNVHLDIPRIRASSPAPRFHLDSSDSYALADWVSGTAELVPTERYPILRSLRRSIPPFVRFSFCPAYDPASMARFRRQCQLLALDTLPASPGPSMRYGRVKDVIAWWEDGHGLWFVSEEDIEQGINLVEAWSKIISKGEEEQTESAEVAYGEICELLGKVVTCLRALHQRHLSSISCRPSTFSLGRTTDTDIVILNWLEAIATLPTHTPATVLKDSPLAASTLFGPDTIVDSQNARLDEMALRKHLRYLAPETAISKRVSPTGDVYAFGVLAYEMLTGSTIDGGPDSPEDADVDALIDIHRHVTMTIKSPLEWLQREAALGALNPHYPPKELSDIVMRCLGKEPDQRYFSLDSLAYDLEKLGRICRTRGDLSKFRVGEADDLARFELPPRIIRRDEQLEALNRALMDVVGVDGQKVGRTQVVNLSGADGSGKTRIARQFAQDIESDTKFPVAWAKADETIHPPLSSFTQVFTALLDRFLTDPNEDMTEWKEKIRTALGNRFNLFISLIPTYYWRPLGVSSENKVDADIDWAVLRGSFVQWARQLLHVFATPQFPLVIVIDDIQWLPSDEAEYWRLLLAGSPAVNHILLISTCRVNDKDINPPSSIFLSPATINVRIPPLTEDDVLQLVKESFHDRILDGPGLTSFIHAETNGSSMFVRTLLNTLVQEEVITFDYEALMWRFEPVSLQKHLSKSGLDSYLEKLVSSLPASARRLLYYVACLPARGFSIAQLEELIGRPRDEIDGMVGLCTASASLLQSKNGLISFAQNGPKSLVYRLIPSDQVGQMHAQISTFLRQPHAQGNFIYEAADHAIAARNMGAGAADDADFAELMLQAVEKTATATSFGRAMRFLDLADGVFESSGGVEEWMKRSRQLYMRFLQLHAEISCIQKNFDSSLDKLSQVTPYLEVASERISIESLRVRLLVAAERMFDAVDLTFSVLKSRGYDPSVPPDPKILPRTPADVERFEASLDEEPADREDWRILIMTLMATAGSAIYYTEPQRRKWIYDLGLSMAMETKKVHETTAYYLMTHSMGLEHDIPMKRALIDLAAKLIQRTPNSFLAGHMLIGVACQRHYWLPWHQLDASYDLAVEGSISASNYEHATNSVAVYWGVRVLSGRPITQDMVTRQYDPIKSYITACGRYIIELALQCMEKLSKLTPGPRPWDLEGDIVTRSDVKDMRLLKMHSAFRHVYALHLAIIYDAPPAEMQAIVDGAAGDVSGVAGLFHGTDWNFMVALVGLRTKGSQEIVESTIRDLEKNHYSPDLEERLRFLKVVQQIDHSVRDALEPAEKLIDDLAERNEHALSGLLSFIVAKALIERTGSPRLATGFLRHTCQSYRQAGWVGVCEMLYNRWPSSCPSPPSPVLLPSHMLGKDSTEPPPMRRASGSNSGETFVSQFSSSSSHEPKKAMDEHLDALALMRSSLALASEQDPPVLLCTLLRILCQFLRADYAAIALSDDTDSNDVRLRAAGVFSRIIPYDLRITEEASRSVCPTSIILHTARTGKAMTSISNFSRFRSDPFYSIRAPRSIICLPISLQGKQKGVVLLSSNTIATHQSQWESAKEVVSTLATFATIITSNVSFTKRLKQEVDQRTQELSNALAAKTQFLSQCSHELRSPLSAVLGLAAVLEASSGLSDVQREHLRTIISSGEDLLGLINNILDHSRLESGSVTLESIPFSCRDVVEGALDSVAAVAQKKHLELCLLNPVNLDPPGLMGDPFRIKQILLNLLSNAVKFTQDGRVTVKWRWEVVDEGKVRVEMDVEDTGIGIPAQKMDKLFRSFSQIDESITRSFGGSGLGLIISKDLARLLGGDCTASSEYGKGSKFTFSIVAERDQAYQQKLRRFEKPHSCFIICDPGPWWEMLHENLKVLNCQPVRFVDDVQQSLVKGHPHGLNSDKQFDFVMLNTQMIDGPTLKRMKELQPNAKMLYLVRSIDLAKAIRELEITREAIISRPIKFSSLMRAMIPVDVGDTSTAASLHDADSSASKKKVNRKMAQTNPLEILLVDDNAVNVTVGRRILELFGYKSITSANDGQQAIEAAEKRQYDLILLDLQMPVLDGFSAQERIRESPLAGNPCIVALTANADASTQQLCVDAGFFNYLSKPLDIPRLEKILGEVFEFRKQHHLNKLQPVTKVDEDGDKKDEVGKGPGMNDKKKE